MKLVLPHRAEVLAHQVVMATSVWQRLVGLLGQTSWPPDRAMVFAGCNSIHTVGLRFPIDVIFMDRNWKGVALRPAVVPGRLIPPIRGAWGTIEMAEGSIQQSALEIGEQLHLATP